jgi:hypothetical protein
LATVFVGFVQQASEHRIPRFHIALCVSQVVVCVFRDFQVLSAGHAVNTFVNSFPQLRHLHDSTRVSGYDAPLSSTTRQLLEPQFSQVMFGGVDPRSHGAESNRAKSNVAAR